ncbi:MAG: adenosylcobinamide-GDP ribazoletransferase [Nitrospinota bacterium]
MTWGLVTAFRTLTILPVPGRDAGEMASSLPWFPVVGGVLGSLFAALALVTNELSGGHWPGGAAAAALAGGIVLTRAIHLDGLADWADGFGGGGDRKKTLAIMKDSATGVFGVTAIVAVLLIKWVSLARLVSAGAFVWIIAAAIISRGMQVEWAAWLSYARPEGGTAASFVNGARPSHRWGALLGALVLLLLFCGPAGGLALAGGWLAAKGYGLWCRRRLGGITGDLLGAGSELVEALILTAAAMAGRELAKLSDWSVLYP